MFDPAKFWFWYLTRDWNLLAEVGAAWFAAGFLATVSGRSERLEGFLTFALIAGVGYWAFTGPKVW